MNKKAIKNRAWKVFSEYIRRSHADRNGYVKCVTCGKQRQWNDSIDAGHYISRRYLSTLFDERNVHPQCKGCNSFKGGALDVYALYLVRTYGKDILEELNLKKNQITKLSISDYQEIIDEYMDKLVGLDIKKGDI